MRGEPGRNAHRHGRVLGKGVRETRLFRAEEARGPRVQVERSDRAALRGQRNRQRGPHPVRQSPHGVSAPAVITSEIVDPDRLTTAQRRQARSLILLVLEFVELGGEHVGTGYRQRSPVELQGDPAR